MVFCFCYPLGICQYPPKLLGCIVYRVLLSVSDTCGRTSSVSTNPCTSLAETSMILIGVTSTSSTTLPVFSTYSPWIKVSNTIISSISARLSYRKMSSTKISIFSAPDVTALSDFLGVIVGNWDWRAEEFPTPAMIVCNLPTSGSRWMNLGQLIAYFRNIDFPKTIRRLPYLSYMSYDEFFFEAIPFENRRPCWIFHILYWPCFSVMALY